MNFLCSIALVLVALNIQADTTDGPTDRKFDSVADVFQSQGVEGTLVVASPDGTVFHVHNDKRSKRQLSPASTFKILNTLIALDTGVVSSKDSEFQWDGTQRGLAAWNKDQTLQSAFKVSCLWCYQEIARKVGENRYKLALAESQYGNQLIGDHVDHFWLNGELQVSAREQVIFLGRLLNNSFQFRGEHVELLKSIMRDEQSPADYTIYAKTGWTGSELAVGWYVGYVEKGDDIWLFAMNMRMESAEQASLRKQLTIQSLQVLDII